MIIVFPPRPRFTLAPELHPDWMLLLFFTHTHLTVTVTLGLLLIPKVGPSQVPEVTQTIKKSFYSTSEQLLIFHVVHGSWSLF